jgi:hypothetical protein
VSENLIPPVEIANFHRIPIPTSAVRGKVISVQGSTMFESSMYYSIQRHNEKSVQEHGFGPG